MVFDIILNNKKVCKHDTDSFLSFNDSFNIDILNNSLDKKLKCSVCESNIIYKEKPIQTDTIHGIYYYCSEYCKNLAINSTEINSIIKDTTYYAVKNEVCMGSELFG